MSNYIKIGRDIIVGKGLSAAHWAGPIVFGRDAIYICPDATQAELMAGLDSGALAGGMVLGVLGGAMAGANRKEGEAKPTWKSQVVDLGELPPEVLGSPDWPVRKSKRPVIVLKREMVEKIERHGGSFLVSACGDTFKLGMSLFGRGQIVAAVQELGWAV